LVVDFACGRSELRQFGLADQDFLFARRRIHIPEFAVFAGVVALHERYLGPVRTPLDRLRSASGNSTFRENLFNRELLRGGWRSGLGAPDGEQNQKVESEDEKKLFHECAPISVRV